MCTPGEPGHLVDDHDQRDSGEVTDEHGPREQVREKTEAHGTGGQRQQADRHREGSREDGVPAGVTGGERPHGDGRHQCGGRLGADRQQPRRSDHGVDAHGRHSRPEPHDRRQPGHHRVRHDLRHQIDGHGEAGQRLPPEPRSAIAQQPGSWQERPSTCGHRTPHRGPPVPRGRLPRFSSSRAWRRGRARRAEDPWTGAGSPWTMAWEAEQGKGAPRPCRARRTAGGRSC